MVSPEATHVTIEVPIEVVAEHVNKAVQDAVAEYMEGPNGFKSIARELYEVACGTASISDDRLWELESILYPRGNE